MILETGKKGWSIIEVLIAILVISVVLVPTIIFVQKYNRRVRLDYAIGQVEESINLAGQYARSERSEIYVIFKEKSFCVRRENGELIGKEHKFPAHIAISEKTAGFDPVIFLPDGIPEKAGYIKITDENSNRTVKINLNNLTGKCTIERIK
jgi:type II secretory pathway pseudopilin PulG